MSREDVFVELGQRAYAHANGDYDWMVICRFKAPMWSRLWTRTTPRVIGFGMSQPKRRTFERKPR